MVVRAIARGVPEHKIAKVLSINLSSLRRRTNPLDGICAEAMSLLKDKQCLRTCCQERKPPGCSSELAAYRSAPDGQVASRQYDFVGPKKRAGGRSMPPLTPVAAGA